MAAGRSGKRSTDIGKVCQCSEKPFNINARLYDSLPNYQLDFTAKYHFIPKYHWLPFLVWCISGSRALSAFLVEDGGVMIVALVPAKAQGCPGNLTPLREYGDFNHRVPGQAWDPGERAPLRPSGGRGRGPRSGRVRWAAPGNGPSAPLTLPSPPASGGRG